MKRAFQTWFMKNYLPTYRIDDFIMMGFVAMCTLLWVIEYYTNDLPIQYQ